jgi:tetratricopeptide (TPR) repeat protein
MTANGEPCKEANILFSKASDLLAEKKIKTALEVFTEAIDLAPGCAKFLCMRSLAHFELNEFDSSLEDAKEAIVAEPTDPYAYFRKAMALLMKNEPSVAYEATLEGLQHDPEYSGLMAIQVISLFALDRYSDLLPVARKTLLTLTDFSLTKKVTKCYTEALKKLCIKEGDKFSIPPAVDEDFGLGPLPLPKDQNIFTVEAPNYIPLPPEYAGMDHADAEAHIAALIAQGTADLDKGNVTMATQLLDNALVVARTMGMPHREAEAIVLLGVAYRMQGKLQQSIDVQKEALASFGPKSKVYSGLGNTYFTQGKLTEALEYHKKHLALELSLATESSGIATAHNNIACVYSAMNQFESSIPEFMVYKDFAVKTNYPMGIVTSCNNIASAYLHLKKYNECHEALQQAMSTHPLLYAESTSTNNTTNQKMAYVHSLRQTYKTATEMYIDLHQYGVALELAERCKTLTWVDACSQRITKANQAVVTLDDLKQAAMRENMTFVSYNLMSKSKIYAYVVQNTGDVHMVPLTWSSDFQWDPINFGNLVVNDERGTYDSGQGSPRPNNYGSQVMSPLKGHGSQATMSPGKTSSIVYGSQVMSPGGRNRKNADFRRTKIVLERLYKELITPLERFLPRDSSCPIVVFPHGKLANIPWNALVDDKGRHNIELRVIIVAMCAATFLSNIQARQSMPDGKGGLCVIDQSIKDSEREKSEFQALGYTILEGSTTPASNITKSIAGASNLHLHCRITCKEIATSEAGPTVGPNYSQTCRTRDLPSQHAKHSSPDNCGSLYFGRLLELSHMVDFRIDHALPIGTLETLPSLKGCKLVTVHAHSESMDDLYTPKTSIITLVRGLMAADATCVVSSILPINNPGASTQVMRTITEKVMPLQNKNMAALAFRDAILEARANQAPWAHWGHIGLFM